jgi:hypothetical protein
LGYFWRVKKKVAKQLHKNKELLAEVVVETPVEGYSKGVLDVMNLASVVGLSLIRGSPLLVFLPQWLRRIGSSKIWIAPFLR